MIHNKNHLDTFIIRCKPNINEDRHADDALIFFPFILVNGWNLWSLQRVTRHEFDWRSTFIYLERAHKVKASVRLLFSLCVPSTVFSLLGKLFPWHKISKILNSIFDLLCKHLCLVMSIHNSHFNFDFIKVHNLRCSLLKTLWHSPTAYDSPLIGSIRGSYFKISRKSL